MVHCPGWFQYQAVSVGFYYDHLTVCLYGYLQSLMAPEMPFMTVNTLHYTMHSGNTHFYSPAHLKLLGVSDPYLLSIAGSATASPTAGTLVNSTGRLHENITSSFY